ncbi:MAG: DeoR/GlpR family DNA-binding transcription regulator [Actinobacteria bacterium]|nr:DeoR/GlpR family DNA-binding transcription regulator [Actinomycetota bacterium]
MFQESRKEKIVNLLSEEKELKVKELCNYFGISLATAHRDLNELKREGRIKKVHGGVMLNIIKNAEDENFIKLNENMELKEKIAVAALEYVENGDCIFLAPSTTCYYFAKQLAESNFRNLMIITNYHLNLGLFLKNENIKVVSTGGLLIKEFGCFVGPTAITTINEFNGNKFFFSPRAISIGGGLSDYYNLEIFDVVKEMHKRCKEHICLVDSSKFNKTAEARIFQISEMDKIITDSKVDRETREEFEKISKKLIIA